MVLNEVMRPNKITQVKKIWGLVVCLDPGTKLKWEMTSEKIEIGGGGVVPIDIKTNFGREIDFLGTSIYPNIKHPNKAPPKSNTFSRA